MDKKPFFLTCSHCLKNSRAESFDRYRGFEITNVVQALGFKLKIVGESGYAVCSNWCKWRHGKASGIHKILNFFFHKSSAYKQ